MKKILIILLLLTSCTNNEVVEKSKNIAENKKSFIEVMNDKNILDIEEKKKIDWSEDIKFTYCDAQYKYGNIDEFNNSIDLILLKNKSKGINYITSYGISYSFPNNIIEYCKSNDSTKYILWGKTKSNTIILGKYDKNIDTFEVIEYKGTFFKNYFRKGGYISNRNYGDISLEKYLEKYIDEKNDISGFGIKYKNIIPFSTYGISITGHAESAPGKFSSIFQFFSKNTREYCSTGLTSKGKLSVCFVDIFYDFDFIENKIVDSRVCSYYIDDDGIIKVLEKCFDINHTYKGYDLKYKGKGIDIYQDETGNFSILDIDIDSAKISFAGVNTKYQKELPWHITKEEINEIPIIDKANINFDIGLETKKSDLYRFYRSYSNNTRRNLKFDYRKYFIQAFINGQFFNQNKNPTLLSFPLKSGGKIINSHVDNDILKRTFIIDTNGNAKILKGYKKEYLENENYKELIVAFSPDVKAQKKSKIGRTYIGINNSKNIVFFVAKDKTQDEMNKLIMDYGIKSDNIIMMDGGPSSQFSYYDNKGPGSEWEQFYGKWSVPHHFVIFTD